MYSQNLVSRALSFLFLTALVGLIGCASGSGSSSTPTPSKPAQPPGTPPQQPPPPQPPGTQPPQGHPQPQPPPDGEKFAPLTWETSGSSSHVAWSNIVYNLVEDEYSALDKVQDAAIFCPRFKQLSHHQRVNFWGMLVSEIARLESSWIPTSRMREPSLGNDQVTHQHVYSEGLLQMSYQDSLWNPGCKFDWSKDRHLSATDSHKTIFSPYRNLKCGVHILAKQISKHSRIALSSGVYWSTLQKGTSKQQQIAAGVRSHLSFCRTATTAIELAADEADSAQ